VALPERRLPLLARNAACPLVAREHNDHNVDSASPVPEHFSNEPFFDSRDEATAERFDIFNDRSSARSPARGNPGHRGRPRVKHALMLARRFSSRWCRKAWLDNVDYSKHEQDKKK
jgi:hypothetical protein